MAKPLGNAIGVALVVAGTVLVSALLAGVIVRAWEWAV